MEKNNKKEFIIVVLSIALVICSIVILMLLKQKTSSQAFWAEQTQELQKAKSIKRISPKIGPIANENDCRDNTTIFRGVGTDHEMLKGFGIYYTPNEINYYVGTVFPKLTDALSKLIDPGEMSKYEWKIGCYFTYNKDSHDGVTKHDFLFIPTLVDKSDQYKVLDFFKTPLYKPISVVIPDINGINQTVTTCIYNTGTMFP